jgi:hypothetical protein
MEYQDNDFARLACELLSNPKYSGKTVLVCWHHSQMPQLALALKATSVPKVDRDLRRPIER